MARDTSNNAKHALEVSSQEGSNKRLHGLPSTRQPSSFDEQDNLPHCEPTPTSEPTPPPVFTRAGRRVRPTWKVRDQLPEAPSTAIELPVEPVERTSRIRHVHLLITERIKTAANRFGITRLYKRRPTTSPEAPLDVNTVYTPTASQLVASRTKRTIAAIVAPYPNLSSFLFGQHFWLHGNTKSVEDTRILQQIITRPDFDNMDLAEANIEAINTQLAGDDMGAPWSHEGEGWLKTPIQIGLPSGQKSTKATRRMAAETLRELNRTERLPDKEPDVPLDGEVFNVGMFYHKDLVDEIRHTFETDPAVKDFVFDPYLLYHSPPGSTRPPEPVYGELFNSPAAVEADILLQNSPPEPDCDLPRAVVMVMGYSDATLVTQFGQTKVWPCYWSYGNQSKYDRLRPTAHASHHVAYFPMLPDSLQNELLEQFGKAGSDAYITHARREIFHAAWHILLNDKFVEAYKHGIVVNCFDGVRRRLYPRLLTYSADYPEKMLVAALRDKGQHPCPHCLITFNDIPFIGTPEDRQRRQDLVRKDNDERKQRVREARELIYDEGYAVNSDKVNDLLKAYSLTPTENAFSHRLGSLGFDIYHSLVSDMLHEFEIGVWKSVVAHLIRILEAIHPDKVHELNARFRQVPIFGENTIRRFTHNVSDMTRIAARDFEDMLQCAIPCFEGLLPSPDNEHVMSLLYLLAYWHGLAKMRLHVEGSVELMDQTFTALGTQLRHFEQVVCSHYLTKETQQEHAARVRARAKASARSSSSQNTINTHSGLSSTSGRKPYTFHLRTIKLHLLGDTTHYIRTFGTTDSFSTMAGEHEHRVLKRRYARTNGHEVEGQIARIGVREVRLRRMANELAEHGITTPGFDDPCRTRQKAATAGPEVHHWIAPETDSRIAYDLRDWQSSNMDDPSVEGFTLALREHVRLRLWAEADNDPHHPFASPNSVLIRNERMYQHATARFNFTTYDVQREQDVIHCPHNASDFPSDKASILVHDPSRDKGAPWQYAMVISIYHVSVITSNNVMDDRHIDVLWVRWLERDLSWAHGPALRRLERLQLADLEGNNAVGFVDPATVIRGCHLIPAFHHGRNTQPGRPSIASSRNGDWYYYYVMRFSDRDLVARHIGMSVGSLELQAFTRETVADDPALDKEVKDIVAKAALHHVAQSTDDLEYGDEQEEVGVVLNKHNEDSAEDISDLASLYEDDTY